MKQTRNSLFPYYKKQSASMELYRIYVFPNKEEVRINKPSFLIVSDNGHRIADSEGFSHYIPYGWIHLYWMTKDDKNFLCERRAKEKKPK